MKLERRLVEKPWGRTALPAGFGDAGGERIGEVWFTGPDDLPLLAKYIFTSERLSIQNHPPDHGGMRGKEECWFVLDAEPDATIGLGWKRPVSAAELRSAALDGSIVELIDWKPVKAGDFIYVPAGTVHAIGGGVSLLEFQQNTDVTYRLYDYGRSRELHLDEAIAVAKLEPYADPRATSVTLGPSLVLVDGPHFALAHAVGDSRADVFGDRRRWVLPIDGPVTGAGDRAEPGECLLLLPGEPISAIAGRAIIGAEA
jgi:mannose-6-phosphate isomerase